MNQTTLVRAVLYFVVLGCSSGYCQTSPKDWPDSLAESFRSQPQWITGPRLLKLGEKIEFEFYLPQGIEPGKLVVFARYLELGKPNHNFKLGGTPDWVDPLESEPVALAFEHGRAKASYLPKKPGSYLARWQVGGETLYRYFSAIEDDWCVLRFSTFLGLEADPTLHGTGIPLDYRLPAENFKPGDPLLKNMVGHNRLFGDSIIPALPDTPKMSVNDRIKQYGEALDRARQCLADPGCCRSARVEMRHALDTGYTETFLRLGVVDHCGLNEANAPPWLGMPEFPYFASPMDCRKVNQAEGGVVAHQWDFCGGWHFIGPVSWHYKASEGNWKTAETCIRQGMDELANLVTLSGHPAFAVPLYDGKDPPGYPNPNFQYDPANMQGFIEKYQRLIAFELPKQYRVAFARSIDIADYYRRHYKVTPRTVYVSRTDHVYYDMWWLCDWCSNYFLVPRDRIPWDTRISTVHRRESVHPFKDPLSFEYVLVEEQRRQMRFERECPSPIWWFDYTNQKKGPEGSSISRTKTPDVKIVRSGWTRQGDTHTMRLKMQTEASFSDYAICLWGLPVPFSADRSRITTNAKDFILVKNTSGEFHLVLMFDLKPNGEITVSVR